MSRCQTRTGSVAGTVDGFSAGPDLVDAGVGEGRDEARHRVGQLQRALLVEHHGRDRRDRLGHRVDAPDRVVRDRQPGVEVAQPLVGQVRDAPAAADRDRPARRADRRRRSARKCRSMRASREASNPTSAGSASTLIRATRPTLPAARDLVVGRETSGCVDPQNTSSGGRHETAGHVDDHERPVVGGAVAGVRGMKRDGRTPGQRADVDVLPRWCRRPTSPARPDRSARSCRR